MVCFKLIFLYIIIFRKMFKISEKCLKYIFLINLLYFINNILNTLLQKKIISFFYFLFLKTTNKVFLMLH